MAKWLMILEGPTGLGSYPDLREFAKYLLLIFTEIINTTQYNRCR